MRFAGGQIEKHNIKKSNDVQGLSWRVPQNFVTTC